MREREKVGRRRRPKAHTRTHFPFPPPPHTHTPRNLPLPGETSTIRKPEGGSIKDVPVSTARVSDGTACVTLHLVGSDECAPAALAPGDTYALRGGLFTAERGGGNALRAGRRGQLERTGYLTGLATDTPDMSAVRFEANAATGLNEPVDPLPASAWAPPGGG